MTPVEHLRLCDSWEAHDAEVERLLGCFNDTRERFRHSFPQETLGPPSEATWCHRMLTGENACCALHVFGREAYVSRLCAWPQRHGHGAEFMRAVERYLRASTTVERVWLFTDADAPHRLLRFYEELLGFREVFDCCKTPAQICDMWGRDHLFVKHLEGNAPNVLVQDPEHKVHSDASNVRVKDSEHEVHSDASNVLVQDPEHKVQVKDPEHKARCDP